MRPPARCYVWGAARRGRSHAFLPFCIPVATPCPYMGAYRSRTYAHAWVHTIATPCPYMGAYHSHTYAHAWVHTAMRRFITLTYMTPAHALHTATCTGTCALTPSCNRICAASRIHSTLYPLPSILYPLSSSLQP